jgi:polyhydroxyalkanoate synthesis regulator phasin
MLMDENLSGAEWREPEVEVEIDVDVGPDVVPGGPVEQIEGTVRRLTLASVGAVASAYDAANDTFERFVDRGEQVQRELQDRRDDVRRQNAWANRRFGDFLRSSMDVFLNRVNLPSKGDVDTINVKLNILTRKLDDLQMQQVRQARSSAAGVVQPTATPTPPPPTDDLAT